MPQSARDLAAALSLANLLFMPVWFELFFRPDSKVYFQSRPLLPVDHGAAIIAVGLLTLILWVAARLARSVRPEVLLPVGSALVIAALVLPLNAVRVNVRLPFGVGRIWHWMHLQSLGLPFLLLSLLLLPVLARLLYRLHRTPSLLVLFTLPFAGVTLGHSGLRMLSRPPPFPEHPQPPTQGPVAWPDGASPRLLWLLFDELDWSMVGPKRPADLSLPALDRLLSESYVADRAESPSDATMTSIPSLLIGRPVKAAQAEGPSELLLGFESSEATRPWSGEASVLSRARELGMSTAIVGWHHPYCRILTSQLDHCSFEPVFLAALAREQETTLLRSLAAQVQALSPLNSRRLARETYLRILEGGGGGGLWPRARADLRALLHAPRAGHLRSGERFLHHDQDLQRQRVPGQPGSRGSHPGRPAPRPGVGPPLGRHHRPRLLGPRLAGSVGLRRATGRGGSVHPEAGGWRGGRA